MPPSKFATHDDCREAVCACCGVKTPKKKMSAKEEASVIAHAKPEYDSKVRSFPAGLCKTCRCWKIIIWNTHDQTLCLGGNYSALPMLTGIGLGDRIPKWSGTSLRLEKKRFDEGQHSVDNCQICQVAKYTPISRKKISRLEKPRVAPDGGPIVTTLKKSSPRKICPTCKAEVSAGIAWWSQQFRGSRERQTTSSMSLDWREPVSTFLARGSEIAKNLMIYRLEIQKELRVTFRVHRTYVQISSYAYLGHIRALQGSRVDICV